MKNAHDFTLNLPPHTLLKDIETPERHVDFDIKQREVTNVRKLKPRAVDALFDISLDFSWAKGGTKNGMFSGLFYRTQKMSAFPFRFNGLMSPPVGMRLKTAEISAFKTVLTEMKKR